MRERLDDAADLREPLLHTKLNVPRHAAALVPRVRLIEQLHDSLNGKLTLICAPAGFGKTTLVSEWISYGSLDAAWISLDAGDNAGGQFWRYMASAIDGIRPGYMEEVKAMLPLLYADDVEQALILLLNELNRQSGRILLVLDDFHVIQEQKMIQAAAYFITHLPPHVHVCLMSRTEPGFPVSRMEAQQLAFRLTADDLRFTAQEAEQFFQSIHLQLDSVETSVIVRQTEGWITGLKLAALSMRRTEDRHGFIRQFTGDNRHVKQYLLEEVWSLETIRMRKFLLKCSILKRWNASLCRAVSGFADSPDLIADLERSHLFVVPLDARGKWFRFHHLFSEFLLQQLELDGEETPALLYKAAGEWCRERRLEEEAVEYFLQGSHYESAIALLEEMSSKVVNWDWSNLGKWLSSIPNAILLEHPVLFFSYVNSLVAEDAGDTGKAEELMREADAWFRVYSAEMKEEQRHLFLAMAHYVRGTLMVFGHHDLQRAREHYEKVVRYAPDGIRIIFGFPEKPLQPETIKTYKIGLGHAARPIAEPYTMQLAELYRSVNPIFLARLFINYAEALYYWNDLEQAEAYLTEGMKWVEQKPTAAEYELIPGWILQGRLRVAAGSLFEATAILEAGMRRMKGMDIPRGVELLDMELIRLQLRSGNSAPLRDWMIRCRLNSSDMVSVYELYDYELFARALMLEGRWDEASMLLDKLLYLAESEMRPIDAAEIASMRSVLMLERGEKRKALQQLEEALRISESNGFVRVLIDEGTAVRAPLAELAAAKQRGYYRGREAASLDFVRTILVGMETGAPFAGEMNPLDTVLTAREMDVFQGLLDHLSGRQIADKLHISYETVKTHRNRIYGKLGVKNRDEAVRRAQEIGAQAKETEQDKKQ
ncbi:LuxR C-terminal-related transcriptional regulator [Paenibacillus validus]|uniref:LuxR C-terminal-related transcriptional regulator n=1 Tax=Paenibacillus validus TaxID=44253 RepID=UPI0013DEC063|nr:LuxR C-terminal-related transcriptional regulator [Paenibacillus validus]MED4600905.1 LuxR C-terminal-related transcriptional regulator [Paenibacillus validus]MED4606677.1 LuxR C-terminal-related transcriptional regulator [Paenibacillus validus]